MHLSKISLALRQWGIGQAAFSPLSLFAFDEQGAWYDPSDLTTIFQDRAGTTPVTADGQTVGKILDKSGRGNHAVAPNDSSRPLYKTDGTYHWLQYDGVDDKLLTNSISFGSVLGTSFAGTKHATGSTFWVDYCFPADTGTGFWACGQSGGTGNYPDAMASDVIYEVMGSRLNPATRDQLYIESTNKNVVTTSEVVTLQTGYIGLSGYAGLLFTGNMYGFILLNRAVSVYEKHCSGEWMAAKSNTSIYPLIGDIGNSVISQYGIYSAVVDLMAGVSGGYIAYPGDTIDQQSAKWTAQTPCLKSIYDAVVINAGINDIAPVSAATIIGKLQTLVNLVSADTNATCKVVISTITPARSRFISLFGAVDGEAAYQEWLLVNQAISGAGATPITGVDGRVTSHTTTLNDGSGSLAGAYAVDDIHPNEAGRQVIADAWRAVLVTLGVVT